MDERTIDEVFQTYLSGDPSERHQRKFERLYALVFWPLVLAIFAVILNFRHPRGLVDYLAFLIGAALLALFLGGMAAGLIANAEMRKYDPDEDAIYNIIDERWLQREFEKSVHPPTKLDILTGNVTDLDARLSLIEDQLKR